MLEKKQNLKKNYIVSLEDHFLYPGAWGILPDDIKEKYRLQKDALIDVGEKRIKQMNAAGIDFQVLSHVEPCLSLINDKDKAITLAKEINDYLYQIISKNPNRLGGFAVLPMQSPKAAVKELERAVKNLGFKGAMVNGHENGIYLDDPSYSPLLSMAEDLDIPIYIHPTDPPKEISGRYFQNNEIVITGWAWQVETAQHVIRMISNGTFDKHPKLKIIIGHMGELIPYGFTRLNQSLTMGSWILKSDIPKMNLYYYFKNNIYVTSSGVFDPPVFYCAKDTLCINNLMFSVDYPFRDNVTATDFLEKLSISENEKSLFAGITACNLLKLNEHTQYINNSNYWEIFKIRLKSRFGRFIISKLVN